METGDIDPDTIHANKSDPEIDYSFYNPLDISTFLLVTNTTDPLGFYKYEQSVLVESCILATLAENPLY
jgi:hypothetical protein